MKDLESPSHIGSGALPLCKAENVFRLCLLCLWTMLHKLQFKVSGNSQSSESTAARSRVRIHTPDSGTATGVVGETERVHRPVKLGLVAVQMAAGTAGRPQGAHTQPPEECRLRTANCGGLRDPNTDRYSEGPPVPLRNPALSPLQWGQASGTQQCVLTLRPW